MASIEELAQGVSSTLQAEGVSDPLQIGLSDEEASEAAALVRAVLAECHDATVPLKLVRVSVPVSKELTGKRWPSLIPVGTRLEFSSEIGERVEFWRREPRLVD